MLVLSRFPDEKIVIGDDIVVTIVDIRQGGRVRVGIEAPAHVRVDREEVRRAIEREAAAGRTTMRPGDNPPLRRRLEGKD